MVLCHGHSRSGHAWVGRDHDKRNLTLTYTQYVAVCNTMDNEIVEVQSL